MKPIKIISILLLICCLCEAKFHMHSIIDDDATNTCGVSINMDPFIRIGSKYYLIEDKVKLNWYGAAHMCRTKGAALASIESAGDMEDISNYLIKHGYTADHWFWIAGNDLEKEGTFKWINTGHPVHFTNWSVGQPDNGGDENCMHLWLKNGFQMNDWQCFQMAYYICEVTSPKTVTLTFW